MLGKPFNKEDDEYYYVKEYFNSVENKESIKPYTKIIESKEEFDVVKEENKISQVSKQSLETIIDMIQEYIEETVSWIYNDPKIYENIEEGTHSGPITEYLLMKDSNDDTKAQTPIKEINKSNLIYLIM